MSLNRFFILAFEIGITENKKYKVFKGTIEDFPTDGEEFDLICMFGTLNHLLRPKEVFKKVSALLKDDGLFVFDHVNRVAKMAMTPHPVFQIQIDHPIYPGHETVYYLLSESGLGVMNKYQTTSATEGYVIKKMSMQNLEKITPKYFDEIEHLSNRMKSIPVKLVVKNLLKKLRSF